MMIQFVTAAHLAAVSPLKDSREDGRRLAVAVA